MKSISLIIFSTIRRFKQNLLMCNSKLQEDAVVSNLNYHASFFDSIDQVPIENWDELASMANLYFNRSYIKAIEKFNSKSIEFRYLILFKNNTPIAIACLQLMDFSMKGIIHNYDENTCFIRRTGNRKFLIKNGNPIRMMICGNVFVSGEHGLYIREEERNEYTIQRLTLAIQELSQSNQLQKPVDAIVVKDFPGNSLPQMKELKQLGYHEFNVEPNMVLQLHPSWKNFEDYLSFMKTKFRTKAKSAFKRSKDLIIINLSAEEIKTNLDQLTNLYRSVEEKAEFNLSVLNLKSYAELKSQLGSNFILRSYWLDDKMIGFLSGLINGNALDAHFVGLNYKYNKQYALYQRILYDYVAIGIEQKLQKINFGRTASEIKSTIGAIPEELTCYAKHRNPVSNRLVKPLFNFLRPTDWEQRLPFKDAMMKTS